MAAVRPTLTVFKIDGSKAEQVKAPAVFAAPIRKDIVQFVHTNMAKNRRQPYAVKNLAGMGYSAESWGPGRAVARIPRISGGGTSRSGQGAFGNMCRGGRMFAPTKVYRKWHRKTSVNMKRYAVVAALAASAVPSLVMARGHAIGQLPEVPLVVDNAVEGLKKTKEAVAALKALGAEAELIKAKNARNVRTGVARLRNRTHSGRKGPLVVYNEDNGITRAFRNLPGVDLVNVNQLNLLSLAPGGHIGRFIIWTKGAVEALPKIFGSTTETSETKKGYTIPYGMMTNTDIGRIINSSEVQSKLRAKKRNYKASTKLNPLTNFSAMVKLNPYALFARRAEVSNQLRAKAQKAKKLEAKRAGKPVPRTATEVKKMAQKIGAAAQRAYNKKRIVDGYIPTAEDVKKAVFNMEKYKKALKSKKTAGASPKAVDFAALKPSAAIVKRIANAAVIKKAIAAKSAKGKAYALKQGKAAKAAASKAKVAPKKK